MSDLPILAAGETDAGKLRPQNEDSFYLSRFNGSTGPAQIERYGYLFVVADGVGGNRGGARAAAIATSRLPAHYYVGQSPDVAANLAGAINAAARDILAEAAATPDRANMICTVVMAVVRGDQATIAHLGDARAYLFRAGRLRQLTKDHSWVQQQVDNGTLTEAEAESHPERNVITKALGNPSLPEPTVTQLRLEAGDRLLLCSDGLSGVVAEPELSSVLANGRDLVTLPPQLIALANQKGGPDNITAVIVQAGKAEKKSSSLPLLLGLSALLPIALGVWLVLRSASAAGSPPVSDGTPAMSLDATASSSGGGVGSPGEIGAATSTAAAPADLGAAAYPYPVGTAPATPLPGAIATPTTAVTLAPTKLPTPLPTVLVVPSVVLTAEEPGGDCAGEIGSLQPINGNRDVVFQWRVDGTLPPGGYLEVRVNQTTMGRIDGLKVSAPISPDLFDSQGQERYSWYVAYVQEDGKTLASSSPLCFRISAAPQEPDDKPATATPPTPPLTTSTPEPEPSPTPTPCTGANC